MIKTKVFLALPIIVLLGWVLSLNAEKASGTLITLPVAGFDPRDIFAGQYLAVRIDYAAFDKPCKEIYEAGQQDRKQNPRGNNCGYTPKDAYYCAQTSRVVIQDPNECKYPTKTSFKAPRDCKTYIQGKCYYGRFQDDISRFYIPEKYARDLEKAVRDSKNKPELLLSVTDKGKAYPVDLLLNDKPWKEWIKENAK